MFSLSTMAQDYIIKQDGDEIQCKLIEVGTDVIKFKKWSNLNGPTFVEERGDIFMIKYENGEKDVFGVRPATVSAQQINPSSVVTISNLTYDKESISGLRSGSTEIPQDYAKVIMGTDWNDFEMYREKRKKGKKLLTWGIICRALGTGTSIAAIVSGEIPLYITATGLRATSSPLLATGIVNLAKSQKNCKRLVKQHNAPAIGFHPEFDFGLGMNSMTFKMSF